MIKEEELKWYRENITFRYVNEVMKKLAIDEQKYLRIERTKALKYNKDFKQCKRCKAKNPLKPKGVFDYCKECAKKRQKELRDERCRSNRADKIVC